MTAGDAALLLIGHGSQSFDGVDQCRTLASMVEKVAGGTRVGLGFLEFASPTTDDAVDMIVNDGATHVVAVPLVLLAAGHLKDDGPAVLARARQRHPRVGFSYARDLAIHPTTLALSTEQARVTLGTLGWHNKATPGSPGVSHQHDGGAAVVLVGRGSTDPDANSDLYKICRLLSDSRGLPPVEPAFVSLSVPSVADALERCRRLGATRIAVVPYFLFTGVLTRRIAEEAASWSAGHRETISVAVCDAMGPEPRLAELVMERFGEAVRGGAHMNCDVCAYRTPMPGYEHRAAIPISPLRPPAG